MFVDDEALPISAHTRRVAELLRLPGVPERWRQQCHESYQQHQQRLERHRTWEQQRQAYARDHLRANSDGDSTAPGEGWTWGIQRLYSPDGAKTWHAMGWFPPDLCEPFAGAVLLFSSRHKPSLADCYFALAAVHDAERDGPSTLNPFADDDIVARCMYDLKLRHTAKLSESDRLTLDDCLAHVEADLRAGVALADTTGHAGGDTAAEPAAATGTPAGKRKKKPGPKTARNDPAEDVKIFKQWDDGYSKGTFLKYHECDKEHKHDLGTTGAAVARHRGRERRAK